MKDRKGARIAKDGKRSQIDAARKPRKEARDLFEDVRVGKTKAPSNRNRAQSCQSTPQLDRVSLHTSMPRQSISTELSGPKYAGCLKGSTKCSSQKAPQKRVRFDEESIERANALLSERIRQEAAEDAKRNPPGVLLAQFSALNELTIQLERL